jgi:hypothetical protein
MMRQMGGLGGMGGAGMPDLGDLDVSHICLNDSLLNYL